MNTCTHIKQQLLFYTLPRHPCKYDIATSVLKWFIFVDTNLVIVNALYMSTHATKCVHMYVLVLYYTIYTWLPSFEFNQLFDCFHIELIFFLTPIQYPPFQKRNLNKYKNVLCHMSSCKLLLSCALPIGGRWHQISFCTSLWYILDTQGLLEIWRISLQIIYVQQCLCVYTYTFVGWVLRLFSIIFVAWNIKR